jgi:glycerol-3-phosphate dehydrogenase (NAD(P)+)
MSLEHIAIVGAGAWGTALANVLARAGRTVALCGRDAAAMQAMAKTRENPRLPGVRLDARVRLTSMAEGMPRTDAMLLVVPAQNIRATAAQIAGDIAPSTPVIVCAKGIETGSGKFMTEVIAETIPQAAPAILSGPSFASDVAQGLPTAVTLAATDETLARSLAAGLGSAAFRPYHSTDIRGVEIGGAAKNVLAIASGIVTGRKLGASAAAALTTRGFAELFRFGRALGARPETLTGLSGLGDLLLTCSSAQSRNFSYGMALGRAAGEERSALAEGVFSAPALLRMAQTHGIDMPIAAAVAAVLDKSLSIDEAIESLLTRPLRAEA